MMYVSVSDMMERQPRLSDPRVAELRLQHVHEVIKAAFPDLESRISSGAIDPNTLREVILTSVLRQEDLTPWLSDEQWSQLGGTVRRIVYDRSGYGCVV